MNTVDAEPQFLDDPLRVYVSMLHTLPPVTREEEISCIQHVRAGGEQAQSSRKRLFEANLLLVVSIAERYQNDRIHVLDLIVKGNEALEQSLQTLSDISGDVFSAYVAGRIESAIAAAATSASPQSL